MKKTFTRKKLGITLGAVAVAAALTGAMIIPAAAADTSSNTSLLTLAASTDDSAAATSGYVLTDVSDVVSNALPSVVSITSRTAIENYYQNYGGNGIEGFWEYFFGGSNGGRGYGQETPDGSYYYYEDNGDSDSNSNSNSDDSSSDENDHSNEVDSSYGSGTIISKTDSEILILTSYHVVEDGSSLYVTFNDNTNAEGTVKSADEAKDIAIVSVPTENIEADTLNSISAAAISTETPEVGEGVIVIGNALGYGISVTTGIVSAVDREITVDGKTLSLIQTDAAINSGNSGGCMLNSKGEIIGISEAKITLSTVEGMCYAIPVANNLDLIQELVNTDGTINSDEQAAENAGYLGIYGRDVSAEISSGYGMPNGIYVAQTVKDGGAANAGIYSGDIITAVNGTEVSSMTELQEQLANYQAGETVSVTIQRLANGQYQSITVDVTLTNKIS